MSESRTFLSKGVTLAIFITSGKIPFCRDLLKTLSNGLWKDPKYFLVTLKFISS